MKLRMNFKFTVEFDCDSWDSGVPYYNIAPGVKKVVENEGATLVSMEHTPYVDKLDHFTDSLFYEEKQNG